MGDVLYRAIGSGGHFGWSFVRRRLAQSGEDIGQSLAARASAVRLYLLLANVIVASLMLVPEQPPAAIGLEILCAGLALWGMISRLDIIAIRRSTAEYRQYFVRHFFMFQLAVIPYLVGGVMVLAGVNGGLYWVAAAMVISLFVASTEAWVLLVEINR